ncbi:MAG: tRNA pseudouridine(38-40) synthase TruA [Myxococcales bacterium]|nr:tRNA pseudouridine(38-40) synthase TruA [Myxococcales bacterium]
MPTFRLTLEYDGRDFAGWQVQPGVTRTVQGALESAFERVTGQRVRVIGSGRTDAGAHAEGQVASVRLETALAPAALQRALNGVLPVAVAVRAAELAPEGFDARRAARSKLYRYAIWNGPIRSPLRAARAWDVRPPLDAAAMGRAARAFLGTHDFASFQAAGSAVRTTVRTLTRFELEGCTRGEIFLWVEGDGFLRHMVRTLVGTLAEVGRGRRPERAMAAILATRERRSAGPTAPAGGLTLVRVDY